ncbi:MAG: 50S ribosomal protein L4 [Clostridia bacterium]|nr:50S ribosomal protein L4 [Clostridia bacterium]
MPNVKVFNMAGNEVGEMSLSEKIFGAEVNGAVLHSAVRAYLLNQRQGTQSTLTRTEVSGGGKKPWRQKGTGRARQGSTRAPQWTHGGIALGPKPRSYRTDLNKKTKRVALFSALSAKVAEGNLVILDECKLEGYKTAEMVKTFNALGLNKDVTKNYKDGAEVKSRTETVACKTLLVLPEVDKLVIKSCDNIPTAATTLYSTINVYEILNAEKLVMTRAAAEKLQEVYA